MTNERPIYPNVDIRKDKWHDGTFNLILETYLRKKHRGKYYLWHFYRNVFVPTDNSALTFIEHFYSEIYRCIILGKIDTKVISAIPPHRKIFELDPDQTPEEQRLK